MFWSIIGELPVQFREFLPIFGGFDVGVYLFGSAMKWSGP